MASKSETREAQEVREEYAATLAAIREAVADAVYQLVVRLVETGQIDPGRIAALSARKPLS